MKRNGVTNRKKREKPRTHSGSGASGDGGAHFSKRDRTDETEHSRMLDPRKRPRQDRSKATVAAILEAAVELFTEMGFAKTTTNRIAERAGVSIGSLYQYYPNKNALLVMLLEQHILHAGPVIEEAIKKLTQTDRDLEQRIRGLFEQVVALHDMAPDIHRMLFEEVPKPPSIQELSLQSEKRMAKLTEEVLREVVGEERPNLDMTAIVLVQTSEALAHWLAIRAPDSLERERFIDESAKMMVRYIGVI